jgi:WD40 repeat protein
LRGLSSYLDGHARGIFRLSWDASWGRVAAGSLDGLVSLWQTNSGDALLGHRSPILDIQPDGAGKKLWSVSADGRLLEWDVPRRTISATFTLASVQPYTFTFAAFSPDGAQLVTDGLSRTVTLWRTSDGSPVRELGAHAAEITSITFSPTGRDVATGGRDGRIMVWAVGGGPGRVISAFDKGRVASLAFNQDGSLLAAGGCGSLIVTGGTSCGRGEIRLFRTSDLSEVSDPLPAASGYVTSLAFSPDGRCMAVGSDDNKIDMRDLGQCAFHGRLPTLHTDTVNVLQFANSGRMFASGSEDADVRLWSADRGLPIGRQFGEHNSIVSALAFSADDTLLFTAGRDYGASNERTIVVHDLTQGSMLESACRIANRNLTQVEWRQYIGDGILEPYRETCLSLP